MIACGSPHPLYQHGCQIPAGHQGYHFTFAVRDNPTWITQEEWVQYLRAQPTESRAQ